MHRLKSKIGYKNQPVTVVIGCLFLASCNFEQYIFIYNYSGSTIELAHIEYIPSTDAYAKEKEVFETLPNRSYRNYQANSFNARNLECGLEIYFKKNGGNYRYVYGGYDPKSRSCMTLQKLKYDQGYYVVIAATGVFIKGADGQWIPMIPQRERPAATPSASMAATS